MPPLIIWTSLCFCGCEVAAPSPLFLHLQSLYMGLQRLQCPGTPAAQVEGSIPVTPPGDACTAAHPRCSACCCGGGHEWCPGVYPVAWGDGSKPGDRHCHKANDFAATGVRSLVFPSHPAGSACCVGVSPATSLPEMFKLGKRAHRWLLGQFIKAPHDPFSTLVSSSEKIIRNCMSNIMT